jgi:acetyltransferase-like isoleucine patch superfamily enzyme
MIKRIKILLEFPINIWNQFVSYLPGNIGFKLRYRFWKNRLKFLGKDVKIDIGVYFQNPQFISIDEQSWIDRGVIILAGADKSNRPRRLLTNNKFQLQKGMVYIGKRVHIAPYCVLSGIGGVYISDECGVATGTKIFSFSNHFRSDEFPSNKEFRFALFVDQSRQFMIEGPVFIDLNVGIASNTTILPGVSIGKDSFVAINSVVMSSFEENSLIGGNPAKRVNDRFKSTANNETRCKETT